MKRYFNKFHSCPRCGERGYEKLRTYSHCVNCLFVHDHSFWATRSIKPEIRQSLLSQLQPF